MDDSQISLSDITKIINRRKWVLILPIVIITTAGIVISVTLSPWYRSEATILIEEQEIPTDFVMATVTSFATQRLQMIHQRVMRHSQLIELINRFDLYSAERARRTIEEVVAMMRNNIALNTISAEVVNPRTGSPATATIAFKLSFEGKNPGKVHKVTTALTSLFLEENLSERTRQTQETTEFLEDEVDRVKSDLTRFDKKISEFKEKHINSLPEFIQVNMQLFDNMEQKIDRMSEQMKTYRERESYYLTQLSAMSPELEYNTGQNRLDDLKIQLVSLRSRFSDEYPDIARIKNEIEQLEKRMAALADAEDTEKNQSPNPMYLTISSQLSGVQSEIRSLKEQIANAEKKREDYRQRIDAAPGLEGEYRTLITERESTYGKYFDLKKKLMESKVAHGLEKDQKGERFTLIDPARFPEKPFKPNRLAVILISIVLGIGAGVGCMSMAEVSDDSIRDTGVLSRTTNLPVLATIPYITTEKETANTRRRYILISAGIVCSLILFVVLFHFLVMDLDIFWVKLMRKFAI